jgi:plastocyanin
VSKVILEEGRFVPSLRPLLLLPLVLAAVLLPGSARSAATGIPLTGAVGQADSFSITLKDANGLSVTQLDPGTYTITVTDFSAFHNFHLFGPGVDQTTDVDGTGTVTWDVTVADGVYTYRCDAHPTQMKHTFRVGAAPPPPPAPTKLVGKVGPAKAISLKKGVRVVKSLVAGRYKIAVSDVTKADNFHLSGPGVNKKTGVKFKGSTSWTVTLKPGKYTFRSDATKKLRRTFSVG